MRILIISNYYPPLELGGWEQLTQEVACLLSRRGHEVVVLASNYRAGEIAEENPMLRRILHLESPDHQRYHPQYSLFQRQREYQNRQSLGRTVAEFKPDIIFFNSMWNLPHAIARHAEQLAPGRVVYYIASTWPTDVNAHTAYWRMPAARPWLQLPKRLAGLVASKVLLASLPRNSLRYHHVLCVSQYMQRYMIDKVGVIPANTRVIYNGIDVADFPWREPNIQPQRPLRLLYAGGLMEHKGVHTAIDAIAHLTKRHKLINFSLSLVGSGQAEYIRNLQASIEAHQIEPYVSFHERVTREEMPALLHAYDVLLFPSTGPEALARMVQEAMACGMPVIGSDSGGTPELLHDGETGLLFEAGNPEMLASKIAQVVSDRTLCTHISVCARKRIEEQFTLERMVGELETYFASIVN